MTETAYSIGGLMKGRMKLVWLLAVSMLVLLLPVTTMAFSKHHFKSASFKHHFKFATATSLDDAPSPEYDNSRANKLPMTGYFEKSFTVGDQTRTAKIFISSDAPNRTNFTVIAVYFDGSKN